MRAQLLHLTLLLRLPRRELGDLRLQPLYIGVGCRQLLFQQDYLLIHAHHLPFAFGLVSAHAFSDRRASCHDFGEAVSIDAQTLGEPGQSTFRLLVQGPSQAASVWMEKQQLAGIATWLDDVLQRLDREQPSDEPDVEPSPISAIYDVEFRATQVGLGYSEEDGLFAIHAFDQRMAGGAPAFRCLISRSQSRVLSRKITEVVAGGRPVCPLCETPIGPEGHVCPKANGHSKVGV